MQASKGGRYSSLAIHVFFYTNHVFGHRQMFLGIKTIPFCLSFIAQRSVVSALTGEAAGAAAATAGEEGAASADAAAAARAVRVTWAV